MRKFLKVLKWLGIIFASLLVLMVVALFVISRDIPPPDVSDLMPPKRPQIGPEDNAFTYFTKAEELVAKPVDAIILRNFLNGKTVETNQLLAVFSENIEMIKQVEEGVKRKVCFVPEVPRYDCFDPHVGKCIGVGRILAAKSRYERITGKRSGSVSTCITLLKYASLLQYNANNDIYYIIYEGIFSFGLFEARGIAQDNSVAQDDLTRLLKSLNAFPSLKTNNVRVLKREYQYDVQDISGGLIKDCLSHVWSMTPDWAQKVKIQPNMTREILASYYRNCIRNVETFSRAQSNLMTEEDLRRSVKYNPLNLIVVLVNGIDYWHYSSESAKTLLGCYYRDECVFSATRLLVALNLYEKRNRKLPENLGQLVPEYIESVPRDPYDGKPFRYDRENEVIYSVGRNLKDDGGSINKIYRGLKHESADRYRAEDIVYKILRPVNIDE